MTTNYRLLARLDSRTTDNRNPIDMAGYVATVRLPERKEARISAPEECQGDGTQ